MNEFGVLKYSDIKAESNELLRSACELVHLRCAKLIAVKAKVLSVLTTVNMVALISFLYRMVHWNV